MKSVLLHSIFIFVIAGFPTTIYAGQSVKSETTIVIDSAYTYGSPTHDSKYPIPKEHRFQIPQKHLLQETTVHSAAIIAVDGLVIHSISVLLPIQPEVNQFTQAIYLRYLSRDPPVS